jgi:hypothetical protein
VNFAGKTASGGQDAGVGILTSDGVKNITAIITENKAGAVCHFAATGTYTVNPNGTGTIMVTPSASTCAGSSTELSSVLFNAANGAAFINVEGRVYLGTFNKQ